MIKCPGHPKAQPAVVLGSKSGSIPISDSLFVAVPWLLPVLDRWVYWFFEFCRVFLCPGAHESGTAFKESQKTGPRFKVSSNMLGEPGIEVKGK